MELRADIISRRIEQQLQYISQAPVRGSLAYQQQLEQEITTLLKQRDAVLIAHYYVHESLQALADKTGGFVGDSLQMARFGAQHTASTVVVIGVRFMGESAKIISPEKSVVMPTLAAECSLDIGCQPDEFRQWRAQYPQHKVVVYANTSAAVKAQADWVVTSSNAVKIVEHLDSLGEKIAWAPDVNLGKYVAKQTGAEMVLWPGTCVVHDEFRYQGLLQLRAVYPDAAILAHPESPESILEIADFVGSTAQMIQAAVSLKQTKCIVATDKGIFYKMQQQVPDKQLIIAPTAGEGATCKSCASCLWMQLNSLENLQAVLCSDYDNNRIEVDEAIRIKALLPLTRMLNFVE